MTNYNSTTLASVTSLSGVIERVLYQNDTFSIVSVSNPCDQNNKPLDKALLSKYGTIVVTGNFNMRVAEGLNAQGQLVNHPKYGVQFQVSSIIVDYTSQRGLCMFFMSSKFTGIGETYATRLAKLLISKDEADPLAALDNLSDDDIKTETGMPKSAIDNLRNIIRDDVVRAKLLSQLAEYVPNDSMQTALYDVYKESVVNIVLSNPYAPIGKVPRYTFNLADTIGVKLGYKPNNEKRLTALAIYVVSNLSEETGDTVISQVDCLQAMTSMGGSCSNDDYLKAISHAKKINAIREVTIYNEIYYQTALLNKAEGSIIVSIADRLDVTVPSLEETDLQNAIATSEQNRAIKYDKTQLDAIKLVASHKLCVVTGGPGTGKTTTVDGIIDVLTTLNGYTTKQIKRIAPTGRAASRLGNGAMTIHAFLGIDPTNTSLKVTPIDSLSSRWFDDDIRVVVVDESSMIDTKLAAQLFSAIPTHVHLILVGDVDQLPSVSPGQVFSDIISLNMVPTARLNIVHRQSDDSTIPLLAEQIKKGHFPAEYYTTTPNSVFVYATAHDHSPTIIRQLIEHALNDTDFGVDDIQIITPQNQGGHGVKDINSVVKYIQNPTWSHTVPTNQVVTLGGEQLTLGDRVMNTVNCVLPQDDTSKQSNLVTNGDIGIITNINTSDRNSKNHTITVTINGCEYVFGKDMWVQLVPAYAITVHKSQGGEFPLVIVNLAGANPLLLNRNLIYTAITRASKMVCIVGDPKQIEYFITKKGNVRKTYLHSAFANDIKN